MSAPITNCTWKFTFQCPREWDRLIPTANPNERLCESCMRNVLLCKTDEEVTAAAKAGRCVAVMIARQNEEKDDTELWLGEVACTDDRPG